MIVNSFYKLWCCVLVLVIQGCGGNSQSDDVSQPIEFDPVADQYQRDAYNIASISNVNAIRNAILLGAKQINGAGGVLGKPLNVVAFVADDADESVRLAKKVLETDIQLINVSYSSRSKAVAALTIPRKIVLISESATSTYFTDFADDDFYFRMVPSDLHQGRVLAQIATKTGATTAVSIYNEGDQYGDTLTREFRINFELNGGSELERLAIPFTTESGFDTYLQQISMVKPDVVINTILDASIAANFVNESAAFEFDSLFILPDASAGVSGFINSIANFNIVDGALGTSPGFGLVDNPQMMFFSDSYQQQFGLLPESFTVNGYDFVMVSALAIERAGRLNHTETPSGEMIRDSLRAVMNPPGVVVSPSNIREALQMVRDGIDVDYSGGYGAIDWDKNGDIVGEITFDVLRVDGATGSWVTDEQEQIIVPLEE